MSTPYRNLRRTKTVTVDRVPTWVSSGDVVIQRGSRTFIRSLTQTEPRWQKLWRWICRQF